MLRRDPLLDGPTKTVTFALTEEMIEAIDREGKKHGYGDRKRSEFVRHLIAYGLKRLEEEQKR